MTNETPTPLLIAENVVAGYLPGVDILKGVDLEFEQSGNGFHLGHSEQNPHPGVL